MKTPTIYLDQNHWINLARAYFGLPHGSHYREVLDTVITTAKTGAAIYPMSDAHVIETRKTPDISHRQRLAFLLAEISQGWAIAPSRYTVPIELEIALSAMFGFTTKNDVKPFGKGLPFAFGRSGELGQGLSKSRAEDLEAALAHPKYVEKILLGNDETTNSIAVQEFTSQMLNFAKNVDEMRNRGKKYSKAIRKRAYLADLTYHLQDDINRLLRPYKLHLSNLLDQGPSTMISLFSSIPTLFVEVELATERDSFWDKQVDPNDMLDISFLSVAIPYCDIVVTEKFWKDIAIRRGLSRRFNTNILSNINDLEPLLDN